MPSTSKKLKLESHFTSPVKKESKRKVQEKKTKIDSDNISAEDFEINILNEVDFGIKESRQKVEWLTKGYRRIKDSKYFYILNKDFSSRLQQFHESTKIADIIISKLDSEKKIIELKFSKKESINSSEVGKLTDILVNLEQNLIALESKLSTIGDQYKITKAERKKHEKRLDALKDSIKQKLKKGIHSGDHTKNTAKDMLERIELANNFQLKESQIVNFEKKAEQDLFVPEREFEKKVEMINILYKIAPRLDKDRQQLKKASSIFNIIKDRFGIFSESDRSQALENGRALDRMMVLNDVLSDADPLHNDFQTREFKDNITEYNKSIFDSIHNIDNIEIQAKEIMLDKVNEILLKIEQDDLKKYLSNEQKFMIEGFKSIIEKTSNNFEELDEIYNILLKKIFNPVRKKIDSNLFLKQEISEFRQNLDNQEESKDEEDNVYEVQDEDIIKDKEEDVYEVQDEDIIKDKEEDIYEVQDEDIIKDKEEDIDEIEDNDLALIIPNKKKDFFIKKSVKELMIEHGVVDLDPSEILTRISNEEMDILLLNLRKDFKKNSDGNRYNFNNSLRALLTEELFEDIDKKERNDIVDGTTQEVYSVLFSAIDAQIQKETAIALADKAAKLAKAGKFGAKLVSNIAIAAGVGIGAGALFGSGGVAAVVAAASIPATKAVMRQLEQSSIFKKTQESSGSFWNNKIGKIFKKDKAEIDIDGILSSVLDKVATKENLAVILSNKLRENTSQDILRSIDSYTKAKKDVIKNPSNKTAEKFKQSLDVTSKEFYKNSLNYLMMDYANQNISDEELSRMAMLMTLNLTQNQRGDVAVSNTIYKTDSKVETLEEKGWIVDKMEKFLKVRSEGIGAMVLGGSLAYAVAETSSVGRVAAGVVAGASAGLMIEKKMMLTSDKKLIQKVDKLISKSKLDSMDKNKKLSNRELDKAKKDSAFIQEQLNNNIFKEDEDALLKNRAQEFVRIADLKLIESIENKQIDIKKIVKEIEKKTKLLEKRSNLTKKKSTASFKKKRELVFMTVGAIVGGAAGYIGASFLDRVKIQNPEVQVLDKTNLDVDNSKSSEIVYDMLTEDSQEEIIPIVDTDKNVEVDNTQQESKSSLKNTSSSDVDNTKEPISTNKKREILSNRSDMYSESSKISNENLLKKPEISNENPLNTNAKDLSWIENKSNINNELESAQNTVIIPEVKDIEAPLEVYQLFSASISDLDNKNPTYLTTDEQSQFEVLTENGQSTKEFLANVKKRGAIYEDSNGRQYHADELDFDE